LGEAILTETSLRTAKVKEALFSENPGLSPHDKTYLIARGAVFPGDSQNFASASLIA
jgi:hypothetical protein